MPLTRSLPLVGGNSQCPAVLNPSPQYPFPRTFMFSRTCCPGRYSILQYPAKCLTSHFLKIPPDLSFDKLRTSSLQNGGVVPLGLSSFLDPGLYTNQGEGFLDLPDSLLIVGPLSGFGRWRLSLARRGESPSSSPSPPRGEGIESARGCHSDGGFPGRLWA